LVRWWGDPVEQFALLDEDLTEVQMMMRLVLHGGRPFAYAQDYDVHTWPQELLSHLPERSRAFDSFIGEPDKIWNRKWLGLPETACREADC